MKKLLLFGLVSLQLTAHAQWTNVPSVSLEDISVGSATQVVGMSGGYVRYFNPITSAFVQSSTYNNFQQVTIAEDGTAWGQGPSSIYKATSLDGNNTVWNSNPATVSLVNLSCRNAQQLVGTVGPGNAQANIYTFDGTTTALVAGNGALAQVSIGTDGTLLGIFGTSGTANVYRHNGSTWSLIPGGLHQISVGDANHIVGQKSGQPMYYNPGTQSWNNLTKPNGNNVTDIEVGADGTIYALTDVWPNNVYRMDWATATCVAITSMPIVTPQAGLLCAGADFEYTLSLSLNEAATAGPTTYNFTGLNGWTGTINGNILTAIPPAAPINSYPSIHNSFTVTATNACSTGPERMMTESVRGPIAPFTIVGGTTQCINGTAVYTTPAGPANLTAVRSLPPGWIQSNPPSGTFYTVGESGDLTFTYDNGCFSASATLEVTVNQTVPEPPVLEEGSLFPCFGQEELYAFSFDPTITSSNVVFSTFNSTWTTQDDTDTSRFITPAGWMFGPFDVVAIASNACGQTQTSVPLSTNQNGLDAYAWFNVVNNELVSGGDAIITNQWMLNGQPIPGANGTTYTPTESGNYNLQVQFTQPFSCDPVLAQEVYIDLNLVGIDESTSAAFGLYPNPFNTEFVIETTALTTVSVMNAMGEVVLSRTINGRTSIDATTLSAGIYFVREETSGVVMKLVKN